MTFQRRATSSAIATLLPIICFFAPIPMTSSFVSPALAATTCVHLDNSHHQFVGTQYTVQNRAVSTALDSNPGAICTTTDNQAWVSAWAMDTGGGWAQSGIWHSYANGILTYFSSYCEYSSSGPCHNVFGTTALSANHTYSEIYNSSTGHIDEEIDSTVIDSTDFNPVGVWTDPWTAEWYAETNDSGNDIPGTATVQELFAGIAYKACTTCSWSSPASTIGNPSSDSTRYGTQWLSKPTDFYVWTK
jgi:hypothetical protein